MRGGAGERGRVQFDVYLSVELQKWPCIQNKGFASAFMNHER